MIRNLFVCLALTLSTAMLTSLTSPSTAFADSPWWEGEWKSDPTEGVYFAVRFGVNQRGVLNFYKGSDNIGGGPITYRQSGDTVMTTRNGVDVIFQLDHANRKVLSANGTPMHRVRSEAPSSGGCEEACWANNASINDLKKKYGASTTPSRFSFAKSHAEGAGQSAFERCVAPHGLAGIMDPVISEKCNHQAKAACIDSCVAAGHQR